MLSFVEGQTGLDALFDQVGYVSTRSGYEVDFIAEDSRGVRELIQVCADLETPGAREREIRALAEGLRETPCDGATIITLREEGVVEVEGRPARILPAWRWLLETEGA